ncbi:MAG TPA: amino acid adenylation domain-containing protein, partial [Pyrinomonadaceae bacterium]|nr:amino acid adenylation domain-containing protein [Pyrinomonadaceae bacterium]
MTVPFPSTAPASTLVELLRRRALDEPTKRAYTFLVDGNAEELHLTYGELDSRARRIAAVLQQISKPGERVLLLYPPGLGYVSAFFGCLYAQLIAVPAYPPDPSRFSRSLPRLRAIVEDSRSTIALTTDPILNRARVLFDESPLLKSMNWMSVDAVEETIADDWRELPVSDEALAFLQYTSGSTGKPKGVMLTHRNLLHNAGLVYHGVEHTPTDSYVSWLPTFHDMGFMAGILQPLYAGIPVVSMSPVAFLQQPFLWLQAISRYRATTSGGPNFAYDLCTHKITPEQRATLDLSKWTVAFNGAEPIRHDTLKRFAKVFAPCGFRAESFYPCYGLAEATLIVTGSRKTAPPVVKRLDARALENNSIAEAAPDDKSARPLVGCGHVLLEQKVVVVNPETLRQCSHNEVGEIWIAGDSVAQGYWSNPDETESTFKARLADTAEGPFLRTGDLGCLTGGELYITGRLKDLIIIRGRNHYPQDIELTAERSDRSLRPGCGAAFSVDDGGAERLVIVQEINYREDPDVDDVIAKIREAVAAEHELETAAVLLIKPGRIPKTTSGKIQRRACRAAFLEGTFEVVGEWRARAVSAAGDVATRDASTVIDPNDVQRWLASQIAMRVSVDPKSIDVTQPIARYGLDSLAAIELAHAIEKQFATVLPLSSLLDGGVAELATQIRESHKTLPPAPATSVEMLPGSETFPLSSGQQALWFLSQLAPESPVYHISSAARVLSPLDTAALYRAFQALVDRHASLRMSFHVVDGEPSQTVHESCVVQFNEDDGSAWTEEQLSERLVTDANEPFNLEVAPLLRVRVYRRAAEEHVLLIVVHHLVADFWSLSVLMSELGVLYAQEHKGSSARFAQSSGDYAAHTRRQKELLDGPEGERLWSYWQNQLSGDVQPLNLPLRGPRPAVQTYTGDSVSFLLDQELTARLNELSRSHDATLFMALLSAFELLLQRYANQDEFFVGSPTAGRDHAGAADLVGYFVNPIVLRANLSGELTFADHLLRVRQTVLEALDHQQYPFPLLVERLQPERDPSRSPIFQVMCALQKAHSAGDEGLGPFALGEAGARLKLGELQLESIALAERTVQFDLTLMMSEAGGQVLGALQFNSDLFDRETIARMAAHFCTLVGRIVNDPQKRLSELSLLSADETQRVLVEWNDTAFGNAAEEVCVQRAFEAQVEILPDAPAVVCGDEQITYRELNERSNRLARYLLKRGVGPEKMVGVLLERSTEMVVALLAILKSGAAYVPLDPSYPQERLAFMLHDCEAGVLITNDALKEKFVDLGIHVVSLDKEASLFDGESGGARARQNLQVNVERDNLAYLIYTSGSTGEPKGVEIQHGGLNNLVRWHQRAYGITSGDRATLLAGPAFDASVWELWPYLTAGASVHIVDDDTRVSAPALLQWLAVQGITICFLPTPLAQLVIAETPPSELSLRAVLTGGDLLHRGPESPLPFILVNHYGPSESTVVTTRAVVSLSAEPPPIGRPIDNTQTYLLNSHLQPVPPGVAGELYVGGAGLARGYRFRRSLTAEKFIPNPFSAEPGARLYATGDLARYLDDGQLEFLGRIDQQVKVRGYRVELGEIEAALCEHSQVREATVIAWEETAGNVQLAAYFVPRNGNGPASAELREFLKSKLPDYMVPSVFFALDRTPVTPNGKVDRKALPSPAEALRADDSSVKPRTPFEELLLQIYSDVLGVKHVGIHDNFFEMGGHSLLATQVMSRVRQTFKVDVPLRELFMSPTVASLAAHLEEAARDGVSLETVPLVPVLRDAELPLSFAQQRLWFLSQLEPDSPFYNIPAALRLRGQLDVAVLEQSLNEIVRRHESLRTNFRSDKGEPVQIISPFQPLSLELEDLSGLAQDEKRDRLRELAANEARRSFDLAAETLLRLRLVKLAENEHVLLLTLHHIISDGWSVRVLVRELSQLYAVFLRGEPSPLAELTLQYADYGVWQREQLQGERLDQELGYWREQLAGAPQVLELPADQARPAVQTYRGAQCSLSLPAELMSGLRAVGRREGATRYMVMLAGFFALLTRYTGQRDLLVGTPVANRTRVETESLVGLFANTLVVRARLEDGPRFGELLKRVREAVLGGQQHQGVPFERVVEELQPERDLSRTPLFQVMFVAEEESASRGWELPGLEVRAERVETGTSKFELTLFVEEESEGAGATGRLRVTAEYNTDLFARESMERLLRHYRRLLESAVSDSGVRVMELGLLEEAEREQLLVGWNQTQRGYGGELVHELFAQQARRTPERTALVCGEQELIYEALERRAERLARWLREQGVGVETRVGVLMQREVELPVTLLAVLKAG